MPKKILMIVEGDRDEKKFFSKLFSSCFKKAEYSFYSYRTNIHVLAQELIDNYPDFEHEEIDIRLILLSLEKNDDRKSILLDNYTDIYLVFDFDPHHKPSHFPIIKRMLYYFNDSTLQGKLYINYPMMQSYKHFSSLPDENFATKQVLLSDIRSYKQTVGNESAFTNLNSYNYVLFYSLAVHHLKKIYFIINHHYCIPSVETYLNMDFVSLFDHEVMLILEKQVVDVVNTCIFALCDYAPNAFFRFISKCKDDLLI